MSPTYRAITPGTITSVVDENHLPAIVRSFKSLGGFEVEVGVFGEAGSRPLSHSTPITMEQLGVILHEGCRIAVTPRMRYYLASLGIDISENTHFIHIPPRPFLDESMGQIEDLVFREVVRAVDQAIDYRPPVAGEGLAVKLGFAVRALLRQVTIDYKNPPNHPWTIFLKGRDDPLEDTGRLQEAIVFEVRQK